MASDTSSQNAETRRTHRAIVVFEVSATIILALATVATAWSGYQATRWGQETNKDQAVANASRSRATRAEALANTQTQIDVAVFSSWADAYAVDNTVLANFYYARFREEFKPAVEAWIATKPLENPDAPLTPFAMPEYKLAAREEAAAQDVITQAAVGKALLDLQRQSNYVFAVVLFAITLFFAGASNRISVPSLRVAVLGIGVLLFIGTMIWVATFPVSVHV